MGEPDLVFVFNGYKTFIIRGTAYEGRVEAINMAVKMWLVYKGECLQAGCDDNICWDIQSIHIYETVL